VKDDPLDVPFGVNQRPTRHLEAEAPAARGALSELPAGIDAGMRFGLVRPEELKHLKKDNRSG